MAQLILEKVYIMICAMQAIIGLELSSNVTGELGNMFRVYSCPLDAELLRLVDSKLTSQLCLKLVLLLKQTSQRKMHTVPEIV